MDKIIFLDTETTGVDADDRILQVAYRVPDRNETAEQLFDPKRKISNIAKATHHITEDDVTGQAVFANSNMFVNLQIMRDAGYTLIAHNAPFDLTMLERDGLSWPKYIDTLKVARHVDDDSMERHNLQYLRYHFDLSIDLGELAPHDALADVIVLEAVYEKLRSLLIDQESLAEEAVLDRMIEISSLPSFVRTITFGKYRGRKVVDVAKHDRSYLQWLFTEKRKQPDGEADWLYTLETVLKQ